MIGRGLTARGAVVAFVAAFTLATVPDAVAVPPPPPNPSDEELQASSDEATGIAERVGSLANQVAEASAALTAAQLELAASYDEVTAAQQRVHSTRAAAQAAQVAADNAHAEVDAAITQLQRARRQLDQFAAASFRQGSAIGSLSAYLGSDSPRDLLARASMLNAVGSSRLNALDSVRQAMSTKANADAAARAATQEATARAEAAEEAKIAATHAYEAAAANETAAQRRTAKLLNRKKSLEARLAQAQRTFAELQGQRQEYADWQSSRRAAEEAAAAARNRPPTANPPAPRPAPHDHPARPGSSGVVAPTTGVITSTYGPRWGSIHYGLDIANSLGTPIVSVLDGVVISSGPASGFGLWVRVRHDNGIITVYGHINETLVYVGQRVAAGEQIATIGNRGQSTGPHLHLEVHKNGYKIDPLVWLRANGVSI
ncbi:septal ring factor EnvC (AmiA/AmiB activator) [Prauserella muralis]|nr:septal ring factor EnvC (AmiA/AmiB activator) [Prauserella muralis]